MSNNIWTKRNIAIRIFIKGELTLLSPAVLGGGEADGFVDSALIRDPLTGLPLLTGASLAGALRDHLRAYKYGFTCDGKGQEDPPWHEELFGFADEHNNPNESWLIISDSLANSAGVEVRDNVSLDSSTGTVKFEESSSDEASDAPGGAKFNFEVLEAGTVFPLRIELLLPEDSEKAERLKQATVIALKGLEEEEIFIGARRTRGFGKCKVKKWQSWSYDLETVEGLNGWLCWNWQEKTDTKAFIARSLGVDISSICDARSTAEISATFQIKDAMMIRALGGDANDPDMKYLESKRNGIMVPILGGTSLAGAFRGRCERILNTIDSQQCEAFLDELFGARKDDSNAHASRLTIEESVIKTNGVTTDRIQDRLKIDRFTGGAYPSAKFNEKPLFARDGGEVEIKFSIKDPQNQEIGLLLFMLKDLWLGDLTIGAESGIGRGSLIGKKIHLQVGNDCMEFRRGEGQEINLVGENCAELFRRYEDAFKESKKWMKR